MATHTPAGIYSDGYRLYTTRCEAHCVVGVNNQPVPALERGKDRYYTELH